MSLAGLPTVPCIKSYDSGPVYRLHPVGLMTTGFVRLLSGSVVMRYRRTHGWFGTHRRPQVVGDTFIITGLSMSIYMVRLSGARLLHSAHGILGAGTIAPNMIALGLSTPPRSRRGSRT